MSLPPGTPLGPYQVVTLLGAGGMGEVYRARDTRLGRDVAIKVLPAEVAADPDRVARFEREAQVLAALSHPNILGIFDFGKETLSLRGAAGPEAIPTQEITYAVTELLEGETLRERLRRERLPWRKAVEIAAAIADGLAAAHGKGIIHRDLKPDNVFITSDGRVKILDFGLARLTVSPLAEAQTFTSPPPGTLAGAVLGTVGYMAPEQVRGEPADARSDIFALGCVLYEMLAGERAFKRDTTAETMTAILREPAPEVSTSGVVATPELNRIVAHCLEKQPAERFQSASDVAFGLRSLSTGGTTTVPVPTRRFPNRALLVAAAAVLIIAAATALLLWKPWRVEQPAAALDPKRIVVAVFENQTGDKSLDPLGRMASDWITQGLSQIGAVEVVSTSAAIHAGEAAPREAGRERADPLHALAEHTGAGTVVSGSYYAQGQTLQFQAKVADVAQGRLIYSVEPVSGTREAPMQVLEALRQRVLGVVAAHFGSVLPLPLMRPPLFEAYREYVAGLELFGEDYAQSVRHFERAAEIDPDFVSPQMYIAVACGNQGDYARADTIIRRVGQNREKLTPVERGMLDWYRASLAGHNAEALTAVRQVRKLVPKSALLAYLVGHEALGVNMPQQTVDAFTMEAPEGFFDVHTIHGSWRFTVLAQAHHMLSDYEGELEVAERAMRALPDMLTVRGVKARALAALGRIAELDTLIDESLGVSSRPGTPSDLMIQASWELRAHGHREEALRLAARAVDWLRSRPPAERAKEAYRPALANALYSAERWEEARAIFEQLSKEHPVAGAYQGSADAQLAREDLPESLRVSRAMDYLGALGTLAARRGDRSEGLRISEALAGIDKPFLFGWNTYWRADIAALLGEKQQAVDLLRESFAQGNTYDVHLHRDMDLEPLWGYPPFIELLRPKG